MTPTLLTTPAADQYGAGGLPFTGLDVRWIALAGALALIGGLLLRRHWGLSRRGTFIAFVALVAAGALLTTAGGARASSTSTLRWAGHDWRVYNGVGRLGQSFAARNVHVNRRGRLVVAVTAHAGGGVAMLDDDRASGSWRVRFRMSRGAGSKYVLLLWPQTGLGPRPEIDFAEAPKDDPQRTRTTASVHPDMVSANVRRMYSDDGLDFTKWHVARVDVSSAGVGFFLDGYRWASYKGPLTRLPLHLCLQATRFSPGRTSLLQIDWIKIR